MLRRIAPVSDVREKGDEVLCEAAFGGGTGTDDLIGFLHVRRIGHRYRVLDLPPRVP